MADNLLYLRDKVKKRINTEDEWDEYLSLGHKHLKESLKSKKFRIKFYSGEWD